MTDQSSNDQGLSEQSVVAWARRQAPHLEVISASDPEPQFREHNLLAITPDPDVARAVVRDWERIEAADKSVGMVVLGRSEVGAAGVSQPRTAEPGADPEGVTGHALRRILVGAIPGAIVGALLVGGIVAALAGWHGTVIGAALGGAAFGGAVTAVLTFATGSGWSSAYEQSFIDPTVTEVVIASIHSGSPGSIDAAAERAGAHGVTAHRVDRPAA